MKKKDAPLPPQQEAFVQAYRRNGRNQRQAYLEAYPKSKKWKKISDVDSHASNLMKEDKVKARIRELDEQSAPDAFAFIDEKIDYLIELGITNIDPEKMRWADVVSLLNLKAKMHGVDAPRDDED